MIREHGDRLDILFVGDVPPLRAGSAISPFQILNGLADAGHQVRAVGPTTSDSRGEGLELVRGSPVEVHWFEMPEFALIRDVIPSDEELRLQREGFQGLTTALIQAHRPDVLICGHEYWAKHLAPVALQYELPSVQLVRGNPGRGIVDGTFPASAAQTVLEDLRRFDCVVAVADYLAEGLRARGVPRVTSIPNVVDIDRFCPRPKSPALLDVLGISTNDVVVAHFSNLKPIKRAMDIVEAASLVLEKTSNVTFLMAGDGLQKGELQERCAELSVTDHFRYPGWVDYERVPELMSIADMVVMASSGEGMSRVYLEAQACGLVLVSSAIPPALQVIEDGVTGVLFAVGDPRDLAEKILSTAADSSLRGAIGAAGRRQVEERHTLATAVDGYESVLFDAIAHHAQRLERDDHHILATPR
jgi:glycosyltransferase involved in cell wall biosynthesis